MKYYCLGIKGAGMSAIACILHDLGHFVTGYDDATDYKFTEDEMNKRCIKIFYDNEHAVDKDTIVTYSRALKQDHKELQRMRDIGASIVEYNQVVGSISAIFKTVAVSGTHGKTTTSLLISQILDNAIGCNYLVGDGTGKASKDNEVFVLESDEYNKHFLAYSPHIAVITNIEMEHVECYSGIEDIIDSFEKFANKAELVIACGDDLNIRKINFTSKCMYYGFNDNNNIVARNVIMTEQGSSFDVYIDEEFYDHVEIPLYGKHMILNSLAAIMVSKYYNVKKDIIEKVIRDFKGAKRRFKETIIGDIVTIDDYAHHPTEVKVTLEAARQKYPDKELVAVFKPNTYSRTAKLYKDFISALSIADKAYVTDVYCDREKQEEYPQINSHLIRDELSNGERITDDEPEKLLCHKNAVICFMSCKDIYTLKDRYEKLIK